MLKKWQVLNSIKILKCQKIYIYIYIYLVECNTYSQTICLHDALITTIELIAHHAGLPLKPTILISRETSSLSFLFRREVNILNSQIITLKRNLILKSLYPSTLKPKFWD